VSKIYTHKLLALAENKGQISEHAQEHALGFNLTVLDKTELPISFGI